MEADEKEEVVEGTRREHVENHHSNTTSKLMLTFMWEENALKKHRAADGIEMTVAMMVNAENRKQ